MILGVHHVAIATGDIDRMIEWYTEAFGCRVVSKGGWQPGNPAIDGIVGLPGSAAQTAMLRAGNVFIEFFQYSVPEGRPGDPNRPVSDHGYTHFGLVVEDIDGEYERLLALGMRFHAPPSPKDGLGGRLRAAYGRDPEGTVIEVMEILSADYPARLDV